MKYKSFHTHLNPKQGEDEPLFIEVEGRFCDKCKKKERKVAIFDVLKKAAELGEQTIDQTDQEYLGILLGNIMTLPDDEWEAVPLEAQNWFNGAVAARNADTKKNLIPYPPGYTGLEGPKKDLSLPPIELKKTPKPPASKAGKKPTTGVTDFTRRLIISNPDWNVRQIYQYLLTNGFPNAKLDSISVARGDIRRVMEIMVEIGWKEPNAAETKFAR